MAKGRIQTSNMYYSVPSKCPWALGFHGPKIGVGAYTEKLSVPITYIHANSGIIKSGGWRLLGTVQY